MISHSFIIRSYNPKHPRFVTLLHGGWRNRTAVNGVKDRCVTVTPSPSKQPAEESNFELKGQNLACAPLHQRAVKQYPGQDSNLHLHAPEACVLPFATTGICAAAGACSATAIMLFVDTSAVSRARDGRRSRDSGLEDRRVADYTTHAFCRLHLMRILLITPYTYFSKNKGAYPAISG